MSETNHGLSMPLRRSAGATRPRTLATMLLLLGTSGSALGAQSASPPPAPTLRVALSGDAHHRSGIWFSGRSDRPKREPLHHAAMSRRSGDRRSGDRR